MLSRNQKTEKKWYESESYRFSKGKDNPHAKGDEAKAKNLKMLIFRAKLKATRTHDGYNFMLIEGIEYAIIEDRQTIADKTYLIEYINS